MPFRQSPTWKHVLLWASSVLLLACAGSPRTARKDLRLDTESAARLRHASSLGQGARALASTSHAASAVLAGSVPGLVTLLERDNAVADLEDRLWECARRAEQQVNAAFFGGRAPTRQECGQEVEVDGCGVVVTRAMRLGQRKHMLALQCAREVLEHLWPAPFSIEQRYRFYPHARLLETVSREEEARLVAQGCTRELWRTIKPDIVLHGDSNLLTSVLTLDFKFPCPDTNVPRWTSYGEKSAYAGSSQGRVYNEALQGEAFMVSPRLGFIP
ncbi:hypothetical protein HUW63_32880 [Myxococcus sp. AM001]|nr:hypothetical protein [Myxococcus sp. AM001]